MEQYMINKRQYIMLSFFLTRMLFLGGGFSLLVGISKNSLLISSILGMLLGYFLLYLFYKKGSMGKLAIFLISASVLTFSLLANTMLTANYLLYNTPTILIMLVFMIPVIFGVSKKINVVSRTSEILMPPSLIISLISFLALIPLVKLDNFLPLINTEFIDLIKGIIIFTGASLLPNLLLINYKNNLKFKDISPGYILGSIVTMIIMFYIIGIYGSDFASILRFPEYLILKKISFSSYFSNIESILVMEWIVNLCIGCTFCLKVLKDNINIYLFYIIITFIFLINEFLFNRNYVSVLYFKNYFYYITFIICLINLFLSQKKVSET